MGDSSRGPIRLRAVLLTLIVALLLSGATAAQAGTITVFDTFGPGDSFQVNSYPSSGPTIFQAFVFVPDQSGELAEITVALGRSDTGVTTTQFDLYEGTMTAFGTLLESLLVTNSAPTEPSTGAVIATSSTLHPNLVAGQIYWLSITQPTAGGSSYWYMNDQGLTSSRMTNSLIDQGAYLPAFRVSVDANAVPLPAPAWTGLIGLVLVIALRKRPGR